MSLFSSSVLTNRRKPCNIAGRKRPLLTFNKQRVGNTLWIYQRCENVVARFSPLVINGLFHVPAETSKVHESFEAEATAIPGGSVVRVLTLEVHLWKCRRNGCPPTGV